MENFLEVLVKISIAAGPKLGVQNTGPNKHTNMFQELMNWLKIEREKLNSESEDEERDPFQML